MNARRLLSTIFALLIVAGPGLSQSHTAIGASTEHTAKSTKIVGPGLDRITFDGKTNKDGLIFQISEPNKIFDPWVITVYNGSDKEIHDLGVALEIEVDGSWYLANINAKTSFNPAVIPPGEFGFATAGSMGGGDDWDDARATIVSDLRYEAGTLINLDIASISANPGGGYSGTIENNSRYSVGRIGLKFACVASDGSFTDEWVNPIDLRKLDPGKSTDFDVSDSNGSCSPGSDFVVVAQSAIRH